jgi:KAP family P-loop domain
LVTDTSPAQEQEANGASPTTKSSGHDAPIFLRDQDDYDRWPIASAISNVIESAPSEWSTRIGLHGRRGDGKTTILNFLEVQQRKRDNIVIRYSPWGLQGEAKLWGDFAKALKDGLKRNGVSMAWYRSAWLWVKQKSG